MGNKIFLISDLPVKYWLLREIRIGKHNLLNAVVIAFLPNHLRLPTGLHDSGLELADEGSFEIGVYEGNLVSCLMIIGQFGSKVPGTRARNFRFARRSVCPEHFASARSRNF